MIHKFSPHFLLPGDKLRWRRRKGRTSPRICRPGTRHRAGHLTRRALPQPSCQSLHAAAGQT